MRKKKVIKKGFGKSSKKHEFDGKNSQIIHSRRVNLNTFYSQLTFKNGSIGRFFVTPPLSEIAKKVGKMLKYTPTFKVL